MATVNHVGLCVTDLQRSRAFYEGAFGFRHRSDLAVPDAPAGTLLQVEPPVGLRAVYLERDGWVLELLHFDRPGNEAARHRPFTEPGLTHISLAVDDLPSACALVLEHGGEIQEDTEIPGMAVMVRDPDGQLLELLPRPG